MATKKKPEAKSAPTTKKTSATKGAQTTKPIVETEQDEQRVEELKKAPIKKAPVVLSNKDRKALTQEQDAEEKIESSLGRIEQYLYKNGKMLLTILGVLVLIACAYLAYKYVYVANRAEKAGSAMFVAEQLFAEDQYELALNGDGNNIGFLEVISKYGSTPQANIAHHYAGICYLNIGDQDLALEAFAKYDATKGVPNGVINAQNKGIQGDIYVKKGECEKAVKKYLKAIDASDNSLTAPSYLMKLGLAYDKLGMTKESITAFQRIADEYPSSIEARDIEKYIGGESQK